MAKTSKPKTAPGIPVNISTGAARVLALCLNKHNQTPIFGSVEEVLYASLLLEGPLAEVKRVPAEVMADFDNKHAEWSAKPFPEFTIAKGQRETVAKGLKALAGHGLLPVDGATIELMKVFDLGLNGSTPVS